MADLSVRYMGLNLHNPLIAGSCGLTGNIPQLKEIEKNGAGAVVLKSLFEEQIRVGAEQFASSDQEKAKLFRNSFEDVISNRHSDYDLAQDYIEDHAKQQTLGKYHQFVEDARKSLAIPVIASINCVSSYDWQFFARSIQDCGVDGLELNIYLLPSGFSHTTEYFDRTYFNILKEVKKYVSIPVALKIGYYSANLARMIKNLSEAGADAMVLFNRPFNPDIDINTMRMVVKNIYSSKEEYHQTLRWMGILSGRVDCDLAASTGIHNSVAVIKHLLAGANAIQMVSALYKHGTGIIQNILIEIEEWMKEKNFKSVNDFRGMLSQQNIDNPTAYERVQFMKHYSGIE